MYGNSVLKQKVKNKRPCYIYETNQTEIFQTFQKYISKSTEALKYPGRVIKLDKRALKIYE